MAEIVAVFSSPQPHIRRVPVDRPWVWLGQGWHDMAKAPKLSLGLGAVSVIAGWLAFSLLVFYDLPYLVLPLTAGFFFMGPFMAVGLYDISRRLELGRARASTAGGHAAAEHHTAQRHKPVRVLHG